MQNIKDSARILNAKAWVAFVDDLTPDLKAGASGDWRDLDFRVGEALVANTPEAREDLGVVSDACLKGMSPRSYERRVNKGINRIEPVWSTLPIVEGSENI